ncbi:MAG: hypothetical protein SFU91_06445 [Chloroherpetonaceae bacterium]|nr:hypothetical protein [Chloroherpetonaceae bacterium]
MVGNPKEVIEKTFLQFYADGRVGEFFLADNRNTLKGFSKLKDENPKKLKDVAVSLVRVGYLKGEIKREKTETTVHFHGITEDGLEYLKKLKHVN